MKDNQINIGVGANVGPLKSGMQEAIGVITSSGAKITAANEQAAARSEGAFKSLQQSYRQTYKDAQILAQQQGINSDAFIEAAKKAAEYKDHLEDVQDAIKGASSEQQWKNVTSAIGSAMNMAQGFVGVMSLIGDESETTTKAMTQMMALGGIANAISSVYQLKDAFVALNAVTQTSVIGLATLVAGLVIYNATIDDTKTLEESLKNSRKSAWEDISTAAKAGMDLEQTMLSALKDGYNKEIAIENSKHKNKKREIQQQYDEGVITLLSYTMRMSAETDRHNYEIEKMDKEHKEKMLNAQKETEKKTLDVLKDGRSKNIALEDWYHKWELQSLQTALSKEEITQQDFNSRIESEKKRHIAALKKIDQTTPSKYGGIYKPGAPNLSDISDEVSKNGKTLGDTLDYIQTNAELAKISVSEDAMAMAQGLSTGISAAIDAANQGGDVGKALSASLLSSMGSFMVAWGAQLIAVGIGAESLKAALSTLNGFAAIAAGAALVVAGSGAIAMASNFSRNKSSSNPVNSSIGTSSFYGPNYTPTATTVFIDGRVRGNDLVIATYNQNLRNGRIK